MAWRYKYYGGDLGPHTRGTPAAGNRARDTWPRWARDRGTRGPIHQGSSSQTTPSRRGWEWWVRWACPGILSYPLWRKLAFLPRAGQGNYPIFPTFATLSRRESGTANRRQGDPPAAQDQYPGGERQEPLYQPGERPAEGKGRADSEEAPDEQPEEMAEYV